MDVSFEQLLQELQQSFEEINYFKFLFNLLITAGLSTLLGIFYVRFGNAVSNRRRFARNFLPLAMTTMVIIFIVKSSVALSLGLVGALSIVRFRSAIKDPEELTYLFLSIAVGLAAGADEVVIACVATLFIMGLLLVQKLIRRDSFFKGRDGMYLNISTPNKDLAGITNALKTAFRFVELKRLDENQDELNASFMIEADSMEQIEQVRKALSEMAPGTSISIIEQRNVAV